jgi:GDPmannose 4,6-dehydratase
MKSKIALITGITGQDGSYLAEFLLKKGYFVIGIKRRTSFIPNWIEQLLNNSNLWLEDGNLSESTCWERLFSEYRPDEIYNLAAQSHVQKSFQSPEATLDATGIGVLRLLEAYRKFVPTARFFQAGSSEMFGNNPEYPQNENTTFMPISPYGCAKVLGYNLVRNYRQAYKLFACNGILYSHESERRGELFVTRKITLAAARIKLGMQDKLYLGNLDAKRDWGHAEDYVRAMWLILKQDVPSDYVIATNTSYSISDFLYTTFSVAGISVQDHVEINPQFYRPLEASNLRGDYSKAYSHLEWQPTCDFKNLITRMYNADFERLNKL